MRVIKRYIVALPSIIDPNSNQPTGNHADVQPAELDPDAVDPDIEICPDEPIFGTMKMKRKKNMLLITFVIFSTNTDYSALIWLFSFVLMHRGFFLH